MSKVPVESLKDVEADCYWCVCKILDGIQVRLWHVVLMCDVSLGHLFSGQLHGIAAWDPEQDPRAGRPYGSRGWYGHDTMLLLPPSHLLPFSVSCVWRLHHNTSGIVGPLHRHLEAHDIRYEQFAWRWINCLLMREMPLDCTIRLV